MTVDHDDDDFNRSLSAYLNATDTVRPQRAMRASFDLGKIAALSGKLISANPFLPNLEPEEHNAWAAGFLSANMAL